MKYAKLQPCEETQTLETHLCSSAATLALANRLTDMNSRCPNSRNPNIHSR